MKGLFYSGLSLIVSSDVGDSCNLSIEMVVMKGEHSAEAFLFIENIGHRS